MDRNSCLGAHAADTWHGSRRDKVNIVPEEEHFMKKKIKESLIIRAQTDCLSLNIAASIDEICLDSPSVKCHSFPLFFHHFSFTYFVTSILSSL